MLRRQRTGSVVCTSCGVLVGVNDEVCFNCGRRNPGLWGFAPALRALGQDLGFVPFVTGACIILYGLSLLATVVVFNQRVGMSGLFDMASPSGGALNLFGASGGTPVFALGRWWTVLSAGWLHGGIFHIFMNMLALRFIAPGTVELYGPGRTVIIYIAGAVAGFALSTIAAAYFPYIPLVGGGALRTGGRHLTVGASASIAGLIGAILYYGRRGGSGMARAYATQILMYMAVLGLLVGGIDNYAHLGGVLGGYGVSRLLDPLKPERVDHIFVALLLLVASALSIVASVISTIRILNSV